MSYCVVRGHCRRPFAVRRRPRRQRKQIDSTCQHQASLTAWACPAFRAWTARDAGCHHGGSGWRHGGGERPPAFILSLRAGLARPPLALTLRKRGEGGRVRPARNHKKEADNGRYLVSMNEETVVLEESGDSNLSQTRLTLLSHNNLFILRALVVEQLRRRCSQHLAAESPSQHTRYCDPAGRRESTRRYQ